LIQPVPAEAAMRIEPQVGTGIAPVGRSLSGLVSLCIAFAGFGCSPNATVNSGPSAKSPVPCQMVELPASASTSVHINNLLDQWAAGKREDAIRTLLELSDSQCGPDHFRLLDLSKSSSPPPVEEEAFGEKMAARLTVLWEIVAETNRRAKQAAVVGEFGTAERLFEAIRRLGVANRGHGSDTILMVDQVGGTIEEIADAGFSELCKRRSEASASAPAPLHIDDVLDQWVAGRREEAIRMLLDLSDSQQVSDYYRPFDLSEQEVVALPLTKREALKANMLVSLDVLREIVREIERRAKQALAAGEFETAKRMFLALKRVGTANRSPEVNLLVGSVGNAIDKIADQGLSDLKNGRTRQPAAP